MIVKREPKGDTKEAVKLSKFFSNKDNTVYPIQSDLQRRYCWPSTHIDKFYKDYIIDLFEKNKEAAEACNPPKKIVRTDASCNKDVMAELFG